MCLIILMLVAPIVPTYWSGRILEITFNLILIAGVYPGVWHSSHRWPFAILTAITLLVRSLNHLTISIYYELFAILFTLIWLLYIVMIIIHTLFQFKNITMDVIVGAVVAYFLIGMCFSQIYIAIEIWKPGSFSGMQQGKELLSFIIFSLGNMSGVSFEPVVPVSTISRSIATLEVVIGTFYVAVTVARLVGLNIEAEKR